MGETKGPALFRGFRKLLLVLGALGVYFGLHDLLPGFSRHLTPDELRHGIFELTIAASFIAGYFFDDLVPKSRRYYLAAAVFILVLAILVGLVIWE